MNKIFNINLGGRPFTIDQDAYEHLHSYLDAIHNHFRNSEGYEEITTDIEARMGELLQEKKGERPIASLKDVKNIIAIMGRPEDFGAEPLAEEIPESATEGRKWKIKTGRRLYRNPEDKIVAGVCSGIAAYFGIEDPIWVRLIFGLFTITGGFAVPLYFVLWGILPRVESASDRLAMRGDPVNVSNIGKIIEEELQHVSRKVSAFSDEIKAEFGSKKKSRESGGEATEDSPTEGHRFSATASEGVSLLSSVIRSVFETLAKIFRSLIFAFGILLVLILLLVWVGTVAALFLGLPFSSFLYPSSALLTSLGVFNTLIFIGIPLLMLALLVMRVFMGTHFKPRWAVGLWIFWAVNFISLMFVTTNVVREFSENSDLSLGATTGFTTADTLYISSEKAPNRSGILQFGNKISISDNRLVSKNVELRIEKSNSGKFELIQTNSSFGRTMDEAQKLAAGLDYQYQAEGNQLILPSFFNLEKGDRWRSQKVGITLRVPEGKWVKLASMDQMDVDIATDRNYKFPIWEKYDYFLKMEPQGMIAPDYINSSEERNSFENFDKIHLRGKVRLEIYQGEAFKVNMLRGAEYAEGVSISQEGTQLNIVAYDEPEGTVAIEIHLPSLTELSVAESDDITLQGFDQENLKITGQDESRMKASIHVQHLEIQLQDDSKLSLQGSGNYLKASLADEARLDAGDFSGRVADINASDDSWVRVSISDTLHQVLDENTKIISLLQPVVISIGK